MKHLVAFVIILCAVSANATLTYDASSGSGATTQNLSWTHTCADTVEGVIVFVWQLVANGGAQDEVTSVTYGGVTMLEATGSPKYCAGGLGDSTTLHCFYLRDGIPRGLSQTVQVNGSVARAKGGGCFTIQSTVGTFAFNDIDVTNCATSGANPSVTLQLNSISSLVLFGFSSGLNVVSGPDVLSAAYTASTEYDLGNCVGGAYRKNVMGTSDTVAGYTASTDDHSIFAIALKDSVATFGRAGTEALDAEGRQTATNTNFGTATTIYFGALRSLGSSHNVYMAFPGLATSLANKTVDSAKLKLVFGDPGTSEGPATYSFRKIRPARNWVEGEATWIIYKTSNNWTDSGASSTASDVFATDYSPFTSITASAENTINVTGLLRQFDGTDTSSLGWVITQSGGTDILEWPFSSANNATAGNRPQLLVYARNGTYSTGGKNPRRKRIEQYRNRRNP